MKNREHMYFQRIGSLAIVMGLLWFTPGPVLQAQDSADGLAIRAPSAIELVKPSFLHPYGPAGYSSYSLFPQYSDSTHTAYFSSYLDQAVQFNITSTPERRSRDFLPARGRQKLTIAQKTWIGMGAAYQSTVMALIAIEGYKDGNKFAAVGGTIGAIFGAYSGYKAVRVSAGP